MRLPAIICCVFLTGCDERVRTVYAAPFVPPDLLQPVSVTCSPGASESAVGVCLIRLRAGVKEANRRIDAVAEILEAAR